MLNDPHSNEWTHPEGNEDMSACQSTEILAERVRFDIIAERNGIEWRVWTDGGIVAWTGTRNGEVVDRGHMPVMLFRLAAHQLAHYCEDMCCAPDTEPDLRHNFVTMWEDSVSMPVDLAMAHPYWAQPDHEANQLKFGFSSIASNMALDAQPTDLKPRRIGLRNTSEIFEPKQ